MATGLEHVGICNAHLVTRQNAWHPVKHIYHRVISADKFPMQYTSFESDEELNLHYSTQQFALSKTNLVFL